MIVLFFRLTTLTRKSAINADIENVQKTLSLCFAHEIHILRNNLQSLLMSFIEVYWLSFLDLMGYQLLLGYSMIYIDLFVNIIITTLGNTQLRLLNCSLLSINILLYKCISYQIFRSKKFILLIVLWFQVSLSNINNIHAMT